MEYMYKHEKVSCWKKNFLRNVQKVTRFWTLPFSDFCTYSMIIYSSYFVKSTLIQLWSDRFNTLQIRYKHIEDAEKTLKIQGFELSQFVYIYQIIVNSSYSWNRLLLELSLNLFKTLNIFITDILKLCMKSLIPQIISVFRNWDGFELSHFQTTTHIT